MTVTKLCEVCSLSAVNIADGNKEVDGAYCCDLLSWVMGKAQADNVWITIMSNINVIAVASLCDVSMVILSENSVLDDDALEKAKIQGINVFSSEMTSFELCSKIGNLI